MNLGYHFDLIREAMRFLDHDTATMQFSDDAIAVTLLANSYTDIFQEKHAELIMDDIFCRLTKPVIECMHYDQLVGEKLMLAYTRQLLVNSLLLADQACQAMAPLKFFLGVGTALHVIQDFYAHSNFAELEIGLFTTTRDYSLFDALAGEINPFHQAQEANKHNRLPRCEGERFAAFRFGLYSHGNKSQSVPSPAHDLMKKDYAGQPHFEWGYRSAFKASVQFLILLREHLQRTPSGAAFWDSLASYTLPDADRGHVRTAVSFDEGTMRWMTMYGGAWKRGRRWASEDIIFDNMPNVRGIGSLEQAFAMPILGEAWLECAISIGDGLFEATNSGEHGLCVRRFTRHQYSIALQEFFQNKGIMVEMIVEAIDLFGLPTAFASWVQDEEVLTPLVEWLKQHPFEILSEDQVESALSELANEQLSTALSALDCPFMDTYQQQIKWIFVSSPYARDLDTGSEWYEFNNEEIGGISDYWLACEIDGMRYTESEYVDTSRPFTNWLVLKPCLGTSPLAVKMEMYESDPSDHTDEEMDLTKPSGKRLQFMIHPSTGEITDLTSGVIKFAQPSGTVIITRGTGELRVSLTVLAGLMSDQRIEASLKCIITDDSMPSFEYSYQFTLYWGELWRNGVLDQPMAISGGYGWRLERPDHPNHLTQNIDLFTFDPGAGFQPADLADLRLAVGSVLKPIALEHFYLRCGEQIRGSTVSLGQHRTDLSSGQVVHVGSGSEPWITAPQTETNLTRLTVCCHTALDSPKVTDHEIFIELLNSNDIVIGKYRLMSPEPEAFRPGTADCFWLGAQQIGDFNAQVYTGKVKVIRRIRLSKNSTNNLRLNWIEFYANGRLIARSEQEVLLNSSVPTWEKQVDYPVEVGFKTSPQFECLGIRPIPGQTNWKALTYKMSAELTMAGYDVNPEVNLFVSPGSELITTLCEVENTNSATVTSLVYLNRHLNTTLNYQWRVEVRPATGGSLKVLDASFNFPEPTVELFEYKFQGGDTLITDRDQPTLVYHGAYEWSVQNFGIYKQSQFDMQFKREPAFDELEPLDQQTFSMPAWAGQYFNYRSTYKLTLQVVDHMDVWMAETSRQVEVPTLAIHPTVIHHGKICSYFSYGDGTIRVNTDDPRYDEFAATKTELRAEYRFAEIILKPYQYREGESFLDAAFGVSYEWQVPQDLLLYSLASYDPAEQQEAYSLLVSVLHRTLRRPPVGFQRIFKQSDLTQPRILIDLRHVGKMMGSTITCKVRDATGQQRLVTLKIRMYTGMSLERILRYVVSLLYRKTIASLQEIIEIRELTEAGLRRDIPLLPFDIDPLALETLPLEERQKLARLEQLVQIYQHYGVKRVARSYNLQNLVAGLLPNLIQQELPNQLPEPGH